MCLLQVMMMMISNMQLLIHLIQSLVVVCGRIHMCLLQQL
jgi:hypothetical protein